MAFKNSIIGFGHIGQRHAAMIHGHDSLQLGAVYDIDPQIEKAISDKSQFIESLQQSDILSVCTPNGLHVEHSLLGLENGCNIICEKPFGLTKNSCLEVINKAKEVNKEVFVVMQNRFTPTAQWLKSAIDQNLLGKIYQVHINCFWNRDNRYYAPGSWRGTKDLDGGVLFTQFSHFVDILYWVFGDIDNVQTKLKNFSHQSSTQFADSGISQFDLGFGAMGSLSFSTSIYDKNQESSITVIGENGSVKIGGQYMDKLEYFHVEGISEPVLPASSPPNNYGNYQGSAANHHFIFDNVVNTLQGKEAPYTTAEEGLMVVDMIERIYGAV